MPSTPEPESPGRLPSTPKAPRYGTYHDDYQPYPTRKSARVAEKAQRVGGGQRSDINNDGFFPSTFLSSPPPTAKTASRFKAGVPTVVHMPPEVRAMFDPRDETLHKHKKDMVMTGTESTSRTGILPTPAKTPTSKHTVVEAGSMGSVTRKLFSKTIDEVMPSGKKKKGNKLGGFEINSDEEEEVPIEIYTDTKERVPEIDAQGNPFYNDPNKPKLKPVSPTTKRRKTGRAGVADHTFAKEGQGVKNGYVMVFRGKKFWRENPKSETRNGAADDAELEEEIDALVPPHLTQPVNPDPTKWLFGGHPSKAKVEDEEDTDIEEKPHKKSGGGVKSQSDKTFSRQATVEDAEDSDVEEKPHKKSGGGAKSQSDKTFSRKATVEDGEDTDMEDKSHKKSGRGAKSQSDKTRSGAGAGAGTAVPDDKVPPRGRTAGRGRGRVPSRGGALGGDKTPFDTWHRTRSPMEDSSLLGSPTRKPRGRRGMATRSSARTAQV